MIRATLLASMTLAATLSIALRARAQEAPTTEVVVTVDPTQPATPIPADYLGLSVEMQNLLPTSDNTYVFRPDNKPLVALFKTLGIHVLRAGGASADVPSQPVPATADLDSFFTFARAAGCKVHYTLRYTQNPTDDAATAKYITDHYKNDLLTFEMGSETQIAGSYDNYKNSLDALVAALKTPDCCPDLPISGPNAFIQDHLDWAPSLAHDYADKGVLSAITLYAYFGGAGNQVEPESGRAELLSTDFLDKYQKILDAVLPACTAAKIPFRFGEANSYYFGGAPNVSNTHAAALWSLDCLHWWAAHGAAGLNFHLGSNLANPEAGKRCRYAAFWTTPDGTYHPHPPAYAMKAFDLAAHGASLPVTLLNAGEVNLTAYAVLNPDKSIYLTLINKELGDNAKTAAIKLTVDGYHTEQFITLTADKNDPAATDSETLGNARIADDGSWSGAWTITTEDSPPLPPATATILHLQPN